MRRALLLLLLAAAPIGLASKPPLAKGTWGGRGLALEVTGAGAELDYDCGHGRIEGAIVPGADGTFTSKGVHVREHGGPIRIDEKPTETPASFAGQVTGDEMTLTVTIEGLGEPMTFKLRRGATPRLMKCK